MSPRLFPLAALAALVLASAACGPAPIGGPPSFELGTGSSSFAPVADGDTLLIQHGTQGGIHVWVAGRVTGMGDPVDVKVALRDADTGESVGYLALEWMVHTSPDGDADAFTGLTARFAGDDASAYDRRRLVLWASVSGQGHTEEDARTITVKAQ